MTTTFSFSRLLQLIRKQWVENSRLYMYSILALLGLLGLIITFWVISSGPHYSEDSLYIIFIFGLYIAGAVFASMSFAMLGNKERGTYWLAFPASHLEKLLCMIFYNVIAFSIVFTLCFFLVKSIGVSYVNAIVTDNPGVYTFRRSLWDSNRTFLNAMPYFLYGFFAVQSFYLMGSSFFARYSFVITTILGSVLIFFFIWFTMELLEGSFNGYSWNGDHIRKYEEGSATYRLYGFSPFVTTLLGFVIKFIWAPVFWLVTWFRLKEKEI